MSLAAIKPITLADGRVVKLTDTRAVVWAANEPWPYPEYDGPIYQLPNGVFMELLNSGHISQEVTHAPH